MTATHSPALDGMAYAVGNRPGYQAPVICWDPELIPLALLPTSTAHPIARLEDQQAMAWLYEALKDGPVPTKDIDDAAAAEGIGKRTLRRAKAALDVQTYRSPFQSGWFSALPASPTRKAVSNAQELGDRCAKEAPRQSH